MKKGVNKKEQNKTCPFCDYVFTATNHRNAHVSTCSIRWQITDDKTEKNQILLNLKINDQKYRQLRQIIEENCCPICYKMFSIKRNVDNHMLTCVKRRSCDKCGQVFNNRPNAYTHMIRCTSNYFKYKTFFDNESDQYEILQDNEVNENEVNEKKLDNKGKRKRKRKRKESIEPSIDKTMTTKRLRTDCNNRNNKEAPVLINDD